MERKWLLPPRASLNPGGSSLPALRGNPSGSSGPGPTSEAVPPGVRASSLPRRSAGRGGGPAPSVLRIRGVREAGGDPGPILGPKCFDPGLRAVQVPRTPSHKPLCLPTPHLGLPSAASHRCADHCLPCSPHASRPHARCVHPPAPGQHSHGCPAHCEGVGPPCSLPNTFMAVWRSPPSAVTTFGLRRPLDLSHPWHGSSWLCRWDSHTRLLGPTPGPVHTLGMSAARTLSPTHLQAHFPPGPHPSSPLLSTPDPKALFTALSRQGHKI